MHALTILTLFIGCGSKATEDTSGDTDNSDTSTDTDTSVDTDPCEPLPDATGHRFEGRVEYADGTTAAGNVRVQMCATSCYVAAWGNDGGFCFKKGILSPGIYSFDTVPTTGEENTYATPLSFIEITADDDVVSLEETVIIPSFTNNQAADGGIFDAGNGLSIDVTTDSFSEETVHSVSVDPTTSGLPLHEFSDRTIIGMWYLGPFNSSTGDSPWSFSVENTSLAPGDQVQIYNASYYDYAWLEGGTATVNEDGVLVSDTNSGISHLSVLLLVQ